MTVGNYYSHYMWTGDHRERAYLCARYARIIRRFSGSEIQRALDVGCGEGLQASTLKSTLDIGRYDGVEASQPLGKVAAARIDSVVEANVGVEPLPFADASYDLATCFHVLEHVFYLERAVGEMLRILRPGGLLLVDVPNVAYWPNRLRLLAGKELIWIGTGKHIRAFTVSNLRRLLVQGGFQILGLYGSILPLPKTRLRVRLPLLPDLCPGVCWSIIAACRRP